MTHYVSNEALPRPTTSKPIGKKLRKKIGVKSKFFPELPEISNLFPEKASSKRRKRRRIDSVNQKGYIETAQELPNTKSHMSLYKTSDNLNGSRSVTNGKTFTLN